MNFLRARSALHLMLAEAWTTLRLRQGSSRGELDRIEAFLPGNLLFSTTVLSELADTLAARRIPLLVAHFPVTSELLFPDTAAGAPGRRWLADAVDGQPGDVSPALRAAGAVPPYLDNVQPTALGHARAAAPVASAALALIRSQGQPYL